MAPVPVVVGGFLFWRQRGRRADADGDGVVQFAEFVFGTDPTDAGSRFTVSASAAGSGMQIGFTPWQGGRRYQLATTPT